MKTTGAGDEKYERFYITEGDDDQLEIFGYRINWYKTVLSWIFTICTVGVLQLVFMWRPDWRLKCTRSRCHVTEADAVLLTDNYDQSFVHKMRSMKVVSYLLQQQRNSKVAGADEPYINASNEVIWTERTYFRHKKLKYQWTPEKKMFERVQFVNETSFNQPCSYYIDCRGLTAKEESDKLVLFGENTISVHVTSIFRLLLTQGLNPFYVFQLFSICLWIGEEYYYYAGCIGLISIISLTAQIYQQRQTERALKSTVSNSGICSVFRRDTKVFEEISTKHLAPGDIIRIPKSGCLLHCDAILLSGNCIVNESMLTGESVPVTKTPLLRSQQDPSLDIKEHARHILFCGTNVIQTKAAKDEEVTAVVIRTGFNTTKGELIRSIMYPKPVDFKFTRDSYVYVGILAGFAVGGMIYTLYKKITAGDDASDVVVRTLDLVTIVVPPALPAAMTCGIVFAQHRLKKLRIFCISPRTINICGGIDLFCFDKTGTLTEDGMDINCLRLADNNRFQNVEHSTSSSMAKLAANEPAVVAMATCHSLAVVQDKIVGDPLDVRMFEFVNWELKDMEDVSANAFGAETIVKRRLNPNDLNSPMFEVGIIRQFTFSSKRQRMSVITCYHADDGVHFDVYAKGAPEMIVSLSDPQTVPDDFRTILREYTERGFRVIGLAWRPFLRLNNGSNIAQGISEVRNVSIENVEKDLQFLGLLVMENRLKHETTGIIQLLKHAKIRPVMVTGDNMMTALKVAQDCRLIGSQERIILASVSPPGMDSEIGTLNWTEVEPKVSSLTNESLLNVASFKVGDSLVEDAVEEDNDKYHFAIDGQSWMLMRQYYPDLIPQLVVRGSVFARFSPDQKKQVVEEFQKLDYYVGMCGDGANDCGALKAAHAGISLSETEASVASPFTSKDPNISCVYSLIREGRAALVTSYGTFKFMAGYAMTQFLGTCIITWIGSTFADFQFLYQDLVLLTTLCITFCWTGSYSIIVPKAPKISLLSFTTFMSLVCIIGFNLSLMIGAFIYVQQQPWCYPEDDDEPNKNSPVTGVFLISAWHYITMSIVFSKGSPYRKSIFTNYIFLINILILVVCTSETIIYPAKFWQDLLELDMPPSIGFRALILGLSTIHFFVCNLCETYFIDGFIDRYVEPKLNKLIKGEDIKYKRIEQQLRENVQWPPMSKITPAATVNSSNINDIELENVDSVNPVTEVVATNEIDEDADETDFLQAPAVQFVNITYEADADDQLDYGTEV